MCVCGICVCARMHVFWGVCEMLGQELVPWVLPEVADGSEARLLTPLASPFRPVSEAALTPTPGSGPTALVHWRLTSLSCRADRPPSPRGHLGGHREQTAPMPVCTHSARPAGVCFPFSERRIVGISGAGQVG